MKKLILFHRLNSHSLVNTDITTPSSLVSWMGAIQSQDFNMGKWGIGVRLKGINDQQIEDSLNKGEIIRTHILRPTWHFVSAEDIYWMLELTAPKIKKALLSYNKELELSPELQAKTNSLIFEHLDKEPDLTRQEIGLIIEKAGIPVCNRRLNHIMFRAELEGIVCNGRIKNKKQTYCLLHKRVTKTTSLHKEESLERLARKYFQSHSPATLQDFVWWSGLNIRDAKEGMESIRQDFYTETIDNQEYWFDNASPSDSIDQDIIHLLPAFDEYFVSYKERKHILDSKYQKKVIVSNGVFRPMIIKNGEIIGTWKRVVKKNAILAEPELFAKQNKKTIDLIQEEASKYKLFNINPEIK